jgi:WD40 repeat protein
VNTHNTYVTDMRHFLDDDGEIVRNMPGEARQLASFLALVVDATSVENSSNFDELPLRCRGTECGGRVLARVVTSGILWFCAVLSVAVSPDRQTLASGSDDKTIKLW